MSKGILMIIVGFAIFLFGYFYLKKKEFFYPQRAITVFITSVFICLALILCGIKSASYSRNSEDCKCINCECSESTNDNK